MQDNRRHHIALAGVAGITLVGLVALLVSLQAPDQPEAEYPLITITAPKPATEAPPAVDLAEDAEPPTPEEPPTAEPVPVTEEVMLVAEEVEEAPPFELAEMAGDADAAQAPTEPRSVDSDPPLPPTQAPQSVNPSSGAPTSTPLTNAPFRVRFASIEDLAGLVEDTHVILVLEFGDGRRFRLPQRLLANTVTVPVVPEQFDAWVAEGRVSELEPTSELRQRLSVHGAGLRYLAVLDDGLRDRVMSLSSPQGEAPTVLTITRGPLVTRTEG